jgi:hypothetical protein
VFVAADRPLVLREAAVWLWVRLLLLSLKSITPHPISRRWGQGAGEPCALAVCERCEGRSERTHRHRYYTPRVCDHEGRLVHFNVRVRERSNANTMCCGASDLGGTELCGDSDRWMRLASGTIRTGLLTAAWAIWPPPPPAVAPLHCHTQSMCFFCDSEIVRGSSTMQEFLRSCECQRATYHLAEHQSCGMGRRCVC